MSLLIEQAELGQVGMRYTVKLAGGEFKTLQPVALHLYGSGFAVSDFLSSGEARRLAYALIEAADRVENPALGEAA